MTALAVEPAAEGLYTIPETVSQTQFDDEKCGERFSTQAVATLMLCYDAQHCATLSDEKTSLHRLDSSATPESKRYHYLDRQNHQVTQLIQQGPGVFCQAWSSGLQSLWFLRLDKA